MRERLLYAIAVAVAALAVLTWLQIDRIGNFALENCNRANVARAELSELGATMRASLRSDIQVRTGFLPDSTSSQRIALRQSIRRDKANLHHVARLPMTDCEEER